MDPHSTRSQFNQRTPRAGPQSRTTAETPKMSSSKKSTSKTKLSTAATAATNNLLIRRPIATNSRVKQDESFKRDMYLSVVTNALQQKSSGITESFDELTSQFNLFSSSSTNSKRPSAQPQQEQTDTAQIRLWLVAISHVVSRLERTHAPLVEAIVNMPWMTLDSATVKAYTIFIGMLLSARPEYLSLVLAKIAQGFTHQSGIQALDASMPSTSTSPLTRRIVYDRLHYLLRHLLSLIPTLPSTLQPLLIRHFPHKRQNQIAQTTYIRNLLRVSSYCPELADRIIATIVDRAIQIDVEIQIEVEELEQDEDLEDHDLFELDPFDVVIGQEPGSSIDGSDSESDDDNDEGTFSDLSSEADELDGAHNEVPTNVKHIQEMVKKLDVILLLLFEHFDLMKKASWGAPELKNTDSLNVSLSELPPLPPLEISTPGLSTPLTPLLGPPYTQSSLDPFNFLSTPSTTTMVSSLSQSTLSSTPLIKPTNTFDKNALRTQFHALLSIFDRTILRTFKSRYTQFLLFWYTSLDPEFADVFQGMLVDRALMPNSGPVDALPPANGADPEFSFHLRNAHTMTPEVTRAAAASYIGSFVSRARFVDKEGARNVVSVLCEYLRAHLDGVDDALRIGGAAGEATAKATIGAILASGQHTVFYAVSQALFLIFCFRWRELMVGDEQDEDHGAGVEHTERDGPNSKGKWMSELLVLKRAIGSILNPLRVCSMTVVNQFAKVANATDFIYCYAILDAARRADATTKSTGSPPRGGAGTAVENYSSLNNPTTMLGAHVYDSNLAELNTFFPFDPYSLPRSSVFIEGVYRKWDDVALPLDDGEEEEEDGDEEQEEDEGADRYGRAAYLDIPNHRSGDGVDSQKDDGGLGESLGAMSISPARVSISVSMRGSSLS